MTARKTITVADLQLLSNGGDVTRDALGLSIDGEQSPVIEGSAVSPPTTFADGIKTGFEYAFRMFGSSLVETDKHWLSFINGGTYKEETYPGIFTSQTFFDHHHVELNPYSEIETKQNGSFTTRSPRFISCKPEINNFYSLYEGSIASEVDVTSIPNGYFINGSTKTDETIINEFQLGVVETSQVNSELENILVVGDRVYEKIEDANQNSNLLPYYIKTNFIFDSTGKFLNEVESNNFQHRFVKILKDSFLSEPGAPAPSDVTFNLNIEQLDASTEPETLSTNLELKVVDVFDLMNYSLTDYNTSEDNFHYLYDDSVISNSQYNADSTRRYDKTIPTIKQTNSLVNFLSTPDFLNAFEAEPINLNQKYHEVVAYRIEKIGGLVTGDRFTQDAIQNFWFVNNSNVEEFEFLDNQVKLNGDYTYRIYKYVLIAGLEYTYSDLAVTRTIADLSTDSLPDTDGWCLEFFDPQTGEPSAPVYDDSADQVQSLINEFATDAQVTSNDGQYLADFKLRVLPSVKIVEVPLLTKQISIIDSPTNSVQVIPTYTLDDSNRLFFQVRYNTKVPYLFPTPITTSDAEYRDKFLISYDLLDDDLVTTESQTLPINLQVYRTSEKPTSLSDFDGMLHKTFSMKMPNQNQTFKTTSFTDKVDPNKKYFYFFRIVNEAESYGKGSNIFEAELVSDGGYKFANFKSYFENELIPPPPSRAIKSFKKLLNISPNITNLIIDDSAVDYTDLAENQIENVNFGTSENAIWDKKYKIRLTSKKTGKKIDINITHKLSG